MTIDIFFIKNPTVALGVGLATVSTVGILSTAAATHVINWYNTKAIIHNRYIDLNQALHNEEKKKREIPSIVKKILQIAVVTASCFGAYKLWNKNFPSLPKLYVQNRVILGFNFPKIDRVLKRISL